MKHDDFMFFETFKEDIDNFRNEFGERAAEKLALDIIYCGVTGERKSEKIDSEFVYNILLNNIKIHIDKSKERFERAKEENAKNKWKKNHSKRRKTVTSELE